MWRRRELLGALGTGAAGLAFLSNYSEVAAADDKSGEHDHKHAEMLKECAEACGHCAATCNAMFHHCLRLAAEGKAHHAKMAQYVIDCGAFCTLSAAMISRHSPLMAESCRACAEACRACAEVCNTADADEMTKKCVESCRRCEQSCRNMVKAMGGEHHHGVAKPAGRTS
jgi:predicted xylose isomerase-like sugar epimerase